VVFASELCDGNGLGLGRWVGVGVMCGICE